VPVSASVVARQVKPTLVKIEEGVKTETGSKTTIEGDPVVQTAKPFELQSFKDFIDEGTTRNLANLKSY
jgi:hypothetical protein